MQNVTIYTDGSVSRNGVGGWACLLSCGPYWKQLSGTVVGTTNNRMELAAVIAGLSQLTEKSNVTIVSDSQLVVNTINTWIWTWAKHGFKRSNGDVVANVDSIRLLHTLLSMHLVGAVWVRAHTRKKDMYSLGNQCCDWFAQHR